MTGEVLDILKLGLLGLLYLFFVRVLWTVWTEVRSVPASSSSSKRVSQSSGGADALSPAAQTALPTKVTIVDPPNRAGLTFSIGDTLMMGRESPTGIRVEDDNFMSGRHARLIATRDHVVLEDLGSRNGTFVNGARIESQTVVRIGDQIRVGYTVMEVR